MAPLKPHALVALLDFSADVRHVYFFCDSLSASSSFFAYLCRGGRLRMCASACPPFEFQTSFLWNFYFSEEFFLFFFLKAAGIFESSM